MCFLVNFTVLDLEAQATSMDDIDDEEEDKEDDIDDEEEDKEDNQDMRDPTPEPNELDEDIVESDLELDHDGVVHPDHDDAPQKVPCSVHPHLCFLVSIAVLLCSASLDSRSTRITASTSYRSCSWPLRGFTVD